MGTKIAHSSVNSIMNHKSDNPAEMAIRSHIPPPITTDDDGDLADEFTDIEIDCSKSNDTIKNNNTGDDDEKLRRQQTSSTSRCEVGSSLARISSFSSVAVDAASAGNNIGSSSSAAKQTKETETESPPETSVDLGDKTGETFGVLYPKGEDLPKPQPPRGIRLPVPVQLHLHLHNNNDDVSVNNNPAPPKSPPSPEKLSAIGKFIRQRSNVISSAIAKRLSRSSSNVSDETGSVTEFTLSGVKVIVQGENQNHTALKGRVTFFSRSNCRDCGAVRSFLKERGLNYAEINIDVYPSRKKELVDRTGTSVVPQIFFNEKLVGGLTELNALRNDGGLEPERLREMLQCKCPDDAPAPPVYGFDEDDTEERADEISGIVRVLRRRLPIQDRLVRMRIVKNCFTGTEVVDFLAKHFNCDRAQAVQVGRELMRKHFIHHVFGEHDFGDGNLMYRFLEHESYITKCYNFRGCTNDIEPKPASVIAQKLAKLMFAILESFATEDRRHVDYLAISNSEEFRRYLNLIPGLQRADFSKLSANEKAAFFLNLYNAMVIHAVIRIGHPDGMIDRKSFSNGFQYLVGGHPFSLIDIKNGILRSNRRPPYAISKPFSQGDKRLQLALPSLNRLIHFGLCDGTKSSPTVRFFTPQNVDAELKAAAREFFSMGGVEVDLSKQTVQLSSILKWYSSDFGSEGEILRWILNYVDANRAGLVSHLVGDWGGVIVSYQNYDWSLNSSS